MRIIGALIIIFSSFMIALNRVGKIDSAVRSVSVLRMLLEHTKNMIECYALPASEILRRFDESLFLDLGYSDGIPRDFTELADKAKIDDTEARAIFWDFSRDFGKSYRKDELLRCSLYLDKIREREQVLIAEAQNRKRVVFTVALCAAVATVILVV